MPMPYFAIYLGSTKQELAWHGAHKKEALTKFKELCETLEYVVSVECQADGEMTVLDTFDPEVLTAKVA
jgi:hypothetical protein